MLFIYFFDCFVGGNFCAGFDLSALANDDEKILQDLPGKASMVGLNIRAKENPYK